VFAWFVFLGVCGFANDREGCDSRNTSINIVFPTGTTGILYVYICL
jgi:hypothetical protein